jgi:hypothetical protein
MNSWTQTVAIPVIRRQSHAYNVSMEIEKMINFVKPVGDFFVYQPVGLWTWQGGILFFSLSLSQTFTKGWPWIELTWERHRLDTFEPYLMWSVCL